MVIDGIIKAVATAIVGVVGLYLIWYVFSALNG